MRNTGLAIFAVISLAIHGTGAALFYAPSETVMDERGAGQTALEVGSLFDSREANEVKAKETQEVESEPLEPEQPKVQTAIPTKTFNHDVVKPKLIKATKAAVLDSPEVRELTVNEDLKQPDILKPTEVEKKKVAEKKAVREIQPLTPPRPKIVEAKKPEKKKPKKVKPKKTTPKKIKPKKRKKTVKNSKSKKQKAQKASKNSRRGGARASAKGKKGARGGGGGKNKKASGKHLVSNYHGLVSRKVRSRTKYPRKAERRNAKGTATISFMVSPSGAMSGLKLRKSSGNKMLDQAILAGARRAAPFPGFKPGMPRRKLTFIIPVYLGLRR